MRQMATSSKALVLRKGKGKKGKNSPERLPYNGWDDVGRRNFEGSLIKRHTFTFQSTSATLRTIAVADLIRVCGFITTVVNTTAVSIHSSVRLVGITLRCPSGAATADEGYVEWASTTSSRDSVRVTTSVGTSYPGVQHIRPPPNSPVSFWQVNTASVSLFSIVASAGSFVDVTLEMTQCNALGPLSISLASGAAALGSLAYGFLDSNHSYTPQGLPTNF